MSGFNDDVITNADKIEKKIKELETFRNSILDASTAKAIAISDYDRELAKTILQLKNNKIDKWEDQDTKNLPATLILKVAAGINYRNSFKKEDADNGYKGLLSIIDAVKAELNGYQSINRHLE